MPAWMYVVFMVELVALAILTATMSVHAIRRSPRLVSWRTTLVTAPPLLALSVWAMIRLVMEWPR